MSQSENLDIEILDENITLSFKQTSGIPQNAGSKESASQTPKEKEEQKEGQNGQKEEMNRQINIKIEKSCDKQCKEEYYFNTHNNTHNSIMMGFSVFIMCATFGMMAKHI
jgi:hypothetical protein